jgi:hypothetical protein
MGVTATPRLRPLGVGEILDAAIKLYVAHAKTLMKVVLVIAVPVEVISLLITVLTTESVDVTAGFTTVDEGSGVKYGDEGVYIGGQAAVILLGFLVVLLATAGCFKAVADAYLGGQASARASLAFAAQRAGAVVWLTALSIVLLALAFLALIVPGIWLGVAWSVALPVLLFEGLGGMAALRRSFALVQGRWWPTAGTLGLGFILAALVATILQGAVIGLVLLAVDSKSFGALLLLSVASVLGQVITTPFQAALLTILYFDLRVRKEGFDLAVLADRMGVPSAPATTPRFLPPVPPEPSARPDPMR